MSVLKKTVLAVCSALSLGVGVSAQTYAAPVTHYSVINLVSRESVFSPEYSGSSTVTADYTGAPVEREVSGSRTWRYSSGSSSPFFSHFFKPETSSVYARADLSTGELKARASLGFGAHPAGTPPLPEFGALTSSAYASAAIADSFSFTSGSSPYIWNNGTQFVFSFAVSGVIDIPDAVARPISFFDSLTYSELRLELFRPGGLDAYQNVIEFDASAYANEHGLSAAYAERDRLTEELTSRQLTSSRWCLGGDNGVAVGWCREEQIVELGEDGAIVNYTFDPGGDFEWRLFLKTQVELDLSYENLTSTVDFSHTIKTSFITPDDATVHSASGVFPNTLPLADSQAIPEPSVLLLVGLGLMGLVSSHGRISRRV